MSKITELAEELRQLLAGGAFPAGARFPSEYELMRRYDVSRLTANKAVALLTAEGLLERGRRGSGTFVRCERKFPRNWIAMLADISHPYSARIVAGAANTALSGNCMLSIFNPNAPDISDTLGKLARSECLGVLTINYGQLPDDFAKPVIYLDNGFNNNSGKPRHSITCDNYGAAVEMMTRILNTGCREVALVTAPHQQHREMRLRGFLDAMRQGGLADPESRSFVIQDSKGRYEMQQTIRAILKRFPGVRYIVTDSDDIVLRIMEVSKIDGLDCPGRIKLSGFGNVYGIADIHHIPTVDQHPWHIGMEAVNALLKLVKEGDNGQVIDIQVPAEVIHTEFL